MSDSILMGDGSWSISISRKEDCIFIKTNDYHADPLQISKSKLIELARLFASSPTQSPPKPSDTQEIATQSGWTIGISKKNKLLFCESREGIAEPLVFSRPDLYRYGKMINKRVKIKKKAS